ncbi:MAG: ISC system 2Fe-2S type ferredoxin [Lautropia sp.]
MARIKVLPHARLAPEGKTFEAPGGTSLCEALLEAGVEIEHACEMSCACTTCHVIVRQGFDELNESSDDEDDLLDMAWGLTPQSRLSCQVRLEDDTDVTIELPKYTINHAREEH